MSLYDQLAAMPAKERDTLLSSLGYTKKRMLSSQVPTTSFNLYPADYPSQGPSTPELEAWLTRKHDPSFRVIVRLPAPGKPPKLSAGRFKTEESAWNEQARRLWRERGVEAP